MHVSRFMEISNKVKILVLKFPVLNLMLFGNFHLDKNLNFYADTWCQCIINRKTKIHDYTDILFSVLFNLFTPQLAGKAHQLGCPKIVLDHVRVLYLYMFVRTTM